MSKYIIKNTAHGPCVMYGEDMFFISTDAGFLDLVDQEPDLMEEIHHSMINQLELESQILVESLKLYQRHDPQRLRLVISSLDLYYKFIYQDYPDYRVAVTRALTGETNSDKVLECNPDHINKFYALLQGDSK